MKLKYLFGVILTVLFMVGCASDDNTLGSLGNITLDKTYVTIPVSGGSATVNVSAKCDWTLSEVPSWLTANVTSGTAGDTQITFTADAVDGGREQEFVITAGGSTQILMVRQGSLEATTATCAEVIAGADGKAYRVKGTCTAIANTTYGNWYLQDNTGQIYIYGTLDAEGKTQNFTSLGIEEGDVIEVEGSKTTYGTTVELVDVTVISIEKSLVKVLSSDTVIARTGGVLEVKLAYKGSGVYPEIPSDYQSWISYASTDFVAGEKADTAIVKFNIAENTGDLRTASIKFNSSNSSSASTVSYTFSQEGVGGIITKPYSVAEAITAASSSVTVLGVYVKGIICKIDNISTSYGNATYYISDDGTESNMLQVYRGYYLDAEKFTSEDQLKVGDEVVVVGGLTVYNGQAELKNSPYLYRLSSVQTTCEDVNNGTDDTTYRVKGVCASIANTKYGNWYIQDETGQVYVYGTLDADGQTANFTSLGIEVGDIVEIQGPKTTYKGSPQLKNVTVLKITKAE